MTDGRASDGRERRVWTARSAEVAQRFGAFALVFLSWEAAVRLLEVPTYVVPPPTVILSSFAGKWSRVMDGALLTGIEMLVGYVLAVAISIPLAVCLAFSRVLERMVFPVVVFFQIMPKVAIAPLFVIWFGFGLLPKVLIVFLLAFFPMLASGIAGFKSVPEDIMEFVRCTGAGRLLVFWRIRLPHALPSIFTGLKIAAALSATAAVVGEFVASDRGLGYLLLEFNGDLDTPMVFAVIVLLSTMGLTLYGLVAWAESAAIPWHVSQRRADDWGDAH
jgi:NitT/TauT family transport system permease protein